MTQAQIDANKAARREQNIRISQSDRNLIAKKGLTSPDLPTDYRIKDPDTPQTEVIESNRPAFQSDPGRAAAEVVKETGDTSLFRPRKGAIYNVETNTFEPADTQKGQELYDESFEEEITNQAEKGTVLQPTRTAVDELGQTYEVEATLEAASLEEFKAKPEMQKFIQSSSAPQTTETNVNRLFTLGDTINTELSNQMQPVFVDTGEASQAVQETLIDIDGYDPQSRALSPKIGRAVAAASIIVGNDFMVKSDERQSFQNTLDTPAGFVAESTRGNVLSPEQFRSRIASTAIDLIAPNPNALSETTQNPNTGETEGAIRSGFGGGSTTVNPLAISALNGIFNNTISELGWFEYTWLDVPVAERTPENAYMRMSAKGAEEIRTLTPLMVDMGLIPEVDVSRVPTTAGETAPGRAREQGRRYAGNISKTNKSDPNTAKEDITKTILGSIPNRIVDDRFSYAKMMVEGLIGVRANRFGGQEVVFKHPPADGNFYSDHVARGERSFGFAETLGIGKQKWLEYYDHAKKTMTDDEATMQANMIMRDQARKILKAIREGDRNKNQIFYNKIMHATSVGRYFYRNTVLNAQNSKLVRMFVGNAQKQILNPNKDTSTEAFENWKYIIGYNLLDGPVDTEDMGWNAISQAAERIINNPNDPIYMSWVKKGNDIQAILNYIEEQNDPVKRREIQLRMEKGESVQYGLDGIEQLYGNLLGEFTKSGEWGYKFQAYLDFAKYDKAKKNNTSFETNVQVQHDGKQNGIAQQAMQTGNRSHLTRVGMIYGLDEDGSPDESNVIPQGDMRAYFMEKFEVQSIVEVFKNDPERLQYWTDFMARVKGHPKAREIAKAIAKQPMMEVSYGRAKEFNLETAQAVINSTEFDTQSALLFPMSDDYAREDMIEDLNSLIASALDASLNLDTQTFLKEIGKKWSMTGTVPEMLGPNGNLIYMGSTEYYQTGKSIMLETTYGPVEIQLTEPRYTGSARQKTRKLVKKKGEKVYTLQNQSVFGQEVANQLPVLPIQQIDAAIIAETILAVNEQRINKNKNSLYVIPVHDAIITDVSSVRKYHQTINNKFKTVNEKYSVYKAILQGFRKQYQESLKDIVPDKQYSMGPDSPYRSLHDSLKHLHDRYRQGQISYEEDGQTFDIVDNLPKKTQQVIYRIITSPDSSWNPEGTGSLNGKELRKLLDLTINPSNLFAKLEAVIRTAEVQKKEVFRELNKLQPYEYN